MSKIKKSDQHKQCKLRRGDVITHSWIPSRYAVVGKTIGLQDEDGKWSEGWVVEEVWGSRPSVDVLAQADFFKKHREGTDARRDRGEDNKPGEWVGPRR